MRLRVQGQADRLQKVDCRTVQEGVGFDHLAVGLGGPGTESERAAEWVGMGWVACWGCWSQTRRARHAAAALGHARRREAAGPTALWRVERAPPVLRRCRRAAASPGLIAPTGWVRMNKHAVLAGPAWFGSSAFGARSRLDGVSVNPMIPNGTSTCTRAHLCRQHADIKFGRLLGVVSRARVSNGKQKRPQNAGKKRCHTLYCLRVHISRRVVSTEPHHFRIAACTC